jgi:hypothetical protein
MHREIYGDQESAGVHVAISSQQADQVDGILLAGDEGEVGRKQVLHHRREHLNVVEEGASSGGRSFRCTTGVTTGVSTTATSLLLLFVLEEGAFVVQGLQTVCLVAERVVATVVIRVGDLAVLRTLPWWTQQGACDGHHPELGADDGGLAGLEVSDDAVEGHGQGGKHGCVGR